MVKTERGITSLVSREVKVNKLVRLTCKLI